MKCPKCKEKYQMGNVVAVYIDHTSSLRLCHRACFSENEDGFAILEPSPFGWLIYPKVSAEKEEDDNELPGTTEA